MARCDSYTDGQCTRGACSLAPWVRDGWGNAGAWPTVAQREGFQLTKAPTKGAIVVYAGGHGYGQLGHVAFVTGLVLGGVEFNVREMNYVRPFTWDDRTSTMWDVDYFILPPGVAAGSDLPSAGAGPSGAAGLQAAWAQFQDLMNSTLDRTISAQQSVNGQLDALGRR